MEEKYYWPHWAKLNADRSLTIKVTGYDRDQTHWIDYVTVARTDAEYEFWLWLSEEREDLLTSHDVELLKRDFHSRSPERRVAVAWSNAVQDAKSD